MPDSKTAKPLSPEAERVLRGHGTERPGSSPLNHEKRAGKYYCAGCGTELFGSAAKYESGSGWPSFWAPAVAENVAAQIDTNNENNSDVETTFVNVPADVAVSFQDPAPEGVADRVLSFEILVFNKVTPEAEGSATGVVATADFLEGFMNSGLFLGAFTGQGTVTVDGDTVTFNIGTIQHGNTVALRIDLLLSASNTQVQIPHDVPLTVSVSSNEIDPDTSNNTAAATASCRCSSRTGPPGWRSWERIPVSRRTCSTG